MPLTINTNLESLNAQRNAALSESSLATSMQRLASGLRVNSAADDAAGLAIGARFDAQVRGMNVGLRNANDGISMLQTADSALANVSEMFQRMRELAVQALNATNNSGDATNLDGECQALIAEVLRTIAQIKFNGIALYVASTLKNVTLQVGANPSDTFVVAFNTGKYASTVANSLPFSLTTPAQAARTIVFADLLLKKTDNERAVLGASMNRLDAAMALLQSGSTDQAAARGRIMDADFAVETASLARAGILQRAGNAMVAQANQRPLEVIALLLR